MKHLGIFIEPDIEMSEFIRESKAYLKKINPNFEYINHPPHMTLVHGHYVEISKIKLKLTGVLKETKNFKIKCSKLKMFENDTFTGLDTIYLEVSNEEKLLKLQDVIVKKLKPDVFYIDKKLNLTEEIKNNLNELNYPFVYPNWIPHFSIASVDSKTANLYFDYFSEKIYFESNVNSVSLWEINNEEHTKLEEFLLTS